MTLRRIALGSFLLLLVPGDSAALPPLCEEVCTPWESCGRICLLSPIGPGTTCGDWGTCNYPVTCNPNYQPVSFTPIGAFEAAYFFPTTCDHIVVQLVTWHDQNNCQGSADYTTCNAYINASREDHQCCVYYWCGGQTSC